jgi:hypothetical protein
LKKYLLPLLLVAGFLFAGFDKASATLAINTATTYGAPVTLTTASGATNALQIISFSVKATTNNTDAYFYEFDFTSTTPPNTNFTNFQLLRNTVNSVAGATNLGATFNFGALNMTITNFTNGNDGDYDEVYKTTYYYFVVADYTASSVGSLTVSFSKGDYYDDVNFDNTSISQTTPVGQAYIFNPPPTVAAADVIAGLSPAVNSNIYKGQSGLAVAGISFKASTASTPLTSLTFAVTPVLSTLNTYFTASNPNPQTLTSNPRLYSSASPTFTTGSATLVPGAYYTVNTVANPNTITFSFNTAQSIGTTLVYYYLVVDYNNGTGNVPQLVTFVPSAYTTGYSGAVTTGYTPNSYTCSPPVTVSAASTGLATSPIAGNQSNIGIFGFTVFSYSATTFTSVTFNSTVTDLSQYFSGVTLYSGPNANFANASAVTGTYTVSALAMQSGFTINAFSTAQTVTNGSLYYFIVFNNYTAPASNVNFQLMLTGFTGITGGVTTNYTALANPNVGLNVNGPAYILAPAPMYIYYWSGLGGTNTDWTNKNNWSTNPSNGGQATNSGTYPGANASDVANITYEGTIWTFNGYPNAKITINVNTIPQIATLLADAYCKVALTVNPIYSLTTGTLTIGSSAYLNASSLTVTASAPSTNPLLTVTGNTNLYYAASLIVPATGIVNFPTANQQINIGSYYNNGNFYASSLSVTGGTVTANAPAIAYTSPNNTYGGNISVSGGSFKATGGTINMATADDNITVSGGTMTLNSCPVTMGGQYDTFDVSGGECAVNTSNITISSNPNGGQFVVTGGKVDYVSGTFAATGKYNTANPGEYFGIYMSGGTFNFSGTTALPSILNLGNTGGSTGVGSLIYLTGGNFNLGAYSTLNINNVNTNATLPYSFYNNGGVVTCASTSVINPTSTTSYIDNLSTATSFTLFSDANGCATIGPLPTTGTPKITGLYNVQRYISAASRNYRLLASPVNETSATTASTTASPNVVNISAIGFDNPTTPAPGFNGAFIAGPGAGFSPNINANPTMYLYQESLLPGTGENKSFTSGKNVGIINISTASPYGVSTQSTAAAGQTGPDNNTSNGVVIPAGNGYLLYYIHDNTSTNTSGPVTTATTTATGYINQGTVPFILWGTQTPTPSTLTYAMTLTPVTISPANGQLYPGVTLVGNPYPSSIDLNGVFTDNYGSGGAFINTPNGGEAFYELNPTNNQFVSYNYSIATGTGQVSGGSSQYIASGQGFYVTVERNLGTLNFKEDQKVTVPVTSLVSESVRVPVTTVDNVTPVSKTTDAVVAVTPAATVNNSIAVNNKPTEAVVAYGFKPSDAGNLKNLAVAVANLKLIPNTGTIKPNDAVTVNTVKVAPNVEPGEIKASYPIVTASAIVPPANTQPAAAAVAVPGLHLKLVQDSVNYDECGVYFYKKFSDNFDSNDARDLDGTGGQVYLSSYSADDVLTSINTMGDYKGGKRVKLFVKFSTTGIYQLQMEDIANFNTNKYSVFLLDKMLNDSLDLTLYKSYNFNYTPGTPNDSTRFVLAIEHKPIPHYALLVFSGQKSSQGVALDWKTVNEANYTTFVLQKLGSNNTYVFLDSLQSDSSGAYGYTDQHPVLGNNTYRLQQTDGLGNITYSAPVTIGYNSTSPDGGLTIYPNPSRSMITVSLATGSTATAVATADIYNTSGVLVEHKVVNSNSFTHDITSYNLGIYVIQLKNSNGVIVGKSKFVKVN